MNYYDESSLPEQNSISETETIDNLIDILLDSTSLETKASEKEETELSDSNLFDLDSEFSAVEKFSDVDSSPQYPDLEVDVEEAKKDITLKEAVEYKAFLRQTVDSESNTDSNSSNGNALKKQEEVIELKTESASTEELVESVNSLIPLIVELLKYKIDEDRETLLEAITPVIEQLIERRTEVEPKKMAIAIAQILPSAITEKIHLSPEEIAKAIAPELALSIKEQIRLDENAISEALGSEMGKAIKTQIEVEKDAMVDALYPVIGDTISKYMVEVVQEINNKVENTLSPEGFKRKIRARIKGVSEAELILQESIGCHVQAIFLIDKDSGLVIQEVQKLGEQQLDSDMVAGMLTAIRSFANDCIVSGSELDTIDYGNWQIHLEVAGYCYLAVVLKGDPTRNFIDRIRHTFGAIILNQGQAIEKFEGDMDTVPSEIRPQLEELFEIETNEAQSSSPTTLLWLLAFILALILIPWGWLSYRGTMARNVETATAVELDAAPELSVYRLEPQVESGKLTIRGRVPTADLRLQAGEIAGNIAEANQLELDNQIVAVNIPYNPQAIAGETARLTKLFNQRERVAISTQYQSRRLSIDGFVLDERERQSIVETFAEIPGIEKTVVNLRDSLPAIEERIYFEIGSDKFDIADNSSKIKYIMQFLNRYPELNLKLVAYSDRNGSTQLNQKLGMQRCYNIRKTLIDRSVEPNRLIVNCDRHRFSSNKGESATDSKRYVRFELFIPMK